MAGYREFAPPWRLAHAIECIWTIEHTGAPERHRVLPDGCADILFTRTPAGATLEAVGPMTRYDDFLRPAGGSLVGVRYRPGMWSASLGIPGGLVTNRVVALEEIWGARSRELFDRLTGASTFEQWIQLLAASLPDVPPGGSVQRALTWMAGRHGCVSLDEMASHAGISTRQFRRLCLDQAGLTPKFLARVLRFRHTMARIGPKAASFADLALDCGYYDQAHLINEFREFSGWTPSSCTDGRFFQSAPSVIDR